MKETEKIFKEMHKFLKDEGADGDINAKIQEFIEQYNTEGFKFSEDSDEMKSDDMLERAYQAETIEAAKRYAKKALKFNPENLDAEVLLATMEKTPVKVLKKLDAIRERSEEKLREEGYFDENCIGAFWGIVETRPYMRMLSQRITILKELGRFSEAIQECENVIRLNEGDNMGIRYDLCGLYCLMERFDELTELVDRYGENMINMLFPFAVAQYKMGDYKSAEKTIRKAHAQNKHVAEFIAMELDVDGFEEEDDFQGEMPGFIRVGHSEEAASTLLMNEMLLNTVPHFPWFYIETLQKTNKKKKSK